MYVITIISLAARAFVPCCTSCSEIDSTCEPNEDVNEGHTLFTNLKAKQKPMRKDFIADHPHVWYQTHPSSNKSTAFGTCSVIGETMLVPSVMITVYLVRNTSTL